MAHAPPTFVKARAFYGARDGYVFKLDHEGLGYYLDNLRKAKLRQLDGEEGPGIPTAPRPHFEDRSLPLTPADLAPKPKAKVSLNNPYADLPAPKEKKARTSAPPPPPPALAPQKPAIRVFTPGLFQVEQVRCLHIVLKHAQSRNPTSWRAPTVKITRTVADATAQLRELRQRLLSASDKRALFQHLARQYSDCTSAKKGGDLGFFKRGKMAQAFEAAAFILEIDELSKIVATSSGVHLILRIA